MTKKKDKMQEDFSGVVSTMIPENQKLAKNGKIQEALDNLYSLEKQTRQAEDQISTSKVAIAIIKICFEAKNYELLNQNLQILAKRRGQSRVVVQDFVKEAMNYLDLLPKEEKLKLIDNLRNITEGKMYVEIERARLTKILAKMKEEEGNISEAANILQEIQVETYGQMDKKEKVQFILEQVRLCLDKKDYIKAQILSNKINKKILLDPDFQDLKIQFYKEMIRYYFHDRKYLDICRSYLAIYETPKVQENEQLWKEYLQLVAIFIVLAPRDNEQSDLLGRVSLDKNLKQLVPYQKLVELFTTIELMRWPEFEANYRPQLNKHSIFTELVDGKNILWDDLRIRVIQHNIRVISTYYSRITMKRFAQLLNLSADETEGFLSDLVVEKTIFAKIDRPAGIITFRKQKDPNEFLNEWAGSIGSLLNLLDKTCHLINRENMVYKIE